MKGFVSYASFCSLLNFFKILFNISFISSGFSLVIKSNKYWLLKIFTSSFFSFLNFIWTLNFLG